MKNLYLIIIYLLLFKIQHSSSSSSSSWSSLTTQHRNNRNSRNSRNRMVVLPMKTQKIPSIFLPPTSSKLPFRRNVSLTVSLSVGTPPQNVTMVLDTGSELTYLHCNSTSSFSPAFIPTNSSSFSPVSCYSPICTTRTRDFSVHPSCDPNNLCHAILSYADMSSAEGNLATDIFRLGGGGSELPGTIFGCMVSGYSSNPEEDSKTTGLMGMNRGSLSFVSQMGFPKFSYCISGYDVAGVLLLGEANFTWLAPLNYTPLVQISLPLPYFDRVAYTVQLEGIRVSDKLLALPKEIFEPDHTGAGQTMVDSGTQFTYILGPAYAALRTEFLNQTKGILRVYEDSNYVFEGSMDLCYRFPAPASGSGSDETVLPRLPSVTLVFRGAEMSVSGEQLLYRVPGMRIGNDSIHCFTFGNSDLLSVEAYIIGNHHQQNVWMEFDLERSRIGLAQVRCDLASQKFGINQN